MADVLTYKNLQDRVLAWLDEVGDAGTTLTLVKYALSKANKQRATQERWPFMLSEPTTFATVLNQQSYALDQDFFRPLYFKNLTLDMLMVQVAESTLVSSRVDWSQDQDSALRFALWGRSDVSAQPTSASVIAVASSSGTDTGTASVTLTGHTANGTVTEMVAVGASSVAQFITLTKVTKSATWVGTLTLTSNAGAVTNLQLFNTEAGRSYQKFFLMAQPPAGEVVEYRFYRQPASMTADTDRPDVPFPFEELLVFDALLQFSAYNEYDGGTVALWHEERDRLLLNLQQAYSDAEAVTAAGDYTTFIPR